ncbi:MAG: DNA alkylation repair protein [Clostridia bacterium]|nr:DNA alkylation repair protein [Clostridia bacterium]
MTLDGLRQLLFQYQDIPYANLSAKLIPTVPRERIIGIRFPEYKNIIRQLRDDPVIPVFLASLPHFWHEENCLHAALINRIRDWGECVSALERFLPYIDNWIVNDSINPACFKKHRAELILKVRSWIASPAPYTRRCGMRLLMANYLDQDFQPSYLDLPADLRSDEYYVNMMTAWLFAEALVKQWDAAVPYLETHRLSPWTNNKAIQKACESFRIPDERKAYLRSLKMDVKKEKNSVS